MKQHFCCCNISAQQQWGKFVSVYRQLLIGYYRGYGQEFSMFQCHQADILQQLTFTLKVFWFSLLLFQFFILIHSIMFSFQWNSMKCCPTKTIIISILHHYSFNFGPQETIRLPILHHNSFIYGNYESIIKLNSCYIVLQY